MSTKIKARKMWASDNTASDLSCDSELMARHSRVHRNPLFVLPGDGASYDAMRKQLSNFFYGEFRPSPLSLRRNPRVAQYALKMADELADGSLASLGITRPAKTRK